MLTGAAHLLDSAGSMALNSLPRRVAKKILAPVISESTYGMLQSIVVSWDIRTKGWYERELDILPYAVHPGETAIDIGANVGLFSYHLSKLVGRSGKVYAFEPIPYTIAAFRRVSRILGMHNVELVPMGCWETAGEFTFTVPLTANGAVNGAVAHIKSQGEAADQKSREILLRTVSVDEHLPPLDSVAFIKCDIEGGELFALKGARKMIERNHPTILCEITTYGLEGAGIQVEELMKFFDAHGYAMHKFENGVLRPAGVTDLIADDRGGRNISPNWIFVHPSRRSRLAKLLPT